MEDTALIKAAISSGWRVSPLATALRTSSGDEAYDPAPHLKLLSDAIVDTVVTGGRLLVQMPPRHGKPIAVDELILMGDGSYRRLGDVLVSDLVITKKGRPRAVSAVHEQGLLPALHITTDCGREVRAAFDHSFLTTDGWKDAGQLAAGDVLVSPSMPACEVVSDKPNAAFRLAGYFVGDGCCGYNGSTISANITCFDDVEIADLYACGLELGFAVKASGKKGRFLFSGGVRDWLMVAGLAGCGSYTKRVPRWVFTAPAKQIAEFLGAYFACDGSINKRGNARHDAAVEFYSVNKLLLQDVQRLLIRIGVQSRLWSKNGRYKGEVHHSWRLAITSREMVTRFADRVSIRNKKAETLKQWRLPRREFDSSFLYDEIVAVEPAGQVECKCLTVEEDESFTVSDLVVHNSHLISTFTPLWFLENWPNRYVINCAYGASFASQWGSKVRDLAKKHEDMLSVRLKGDSMAADKWRTDKGGGMTTAGIGGGITGRGAHLLLIDDPIKNWEEASSWTLRERHWAWWVSTARTRVEAVMKGNKRVSDGAVIVVLTRWNEDDLAGRLLAQGAENWRVISLPAIWDEKAASMGPCPLGRKIGDPLWPNRWPVSALEPLMRSSTAVWESLYQQRPGTTAGLGNVYADFKEHKHVRSCTRDSRLPLVWSLDFNRDPFCTVISQYKEYLGPHSHLTNEKLAIVEVLDELCLEDAGTLDMCQAFLTRARDICGSSRVDLEIYGDPAAAARHTSQTSGSDYDIIRNFFRNHQQFKVRMDIARKAPAIKDRINTVNGMFRNVFGESRATVDPRCKMLRRDLQNVRWKRDLNGNTTGQLDKSQKDLTHVSDAWGYFLDRKFGRQGSQSGERSGLMQ